MITSFADRATEDIFHGAETKAARAIPKDVWPIARRKLDALNAALTPSDLRAHPGNRLEKLEGKLKDRWSVRLDDQFRLVFRFENGAASEAQILDYH